MRQSTWYILCILGLATLCLSSPIVKREALDENDALDPAEQVRNNFKTKFIVPIQNKMKKFYGTK